MRERDFINWIIACAERLGWAVYHVPAPMVASRKGGFVGSPRAAGLPDLFLLHDDPPRMIIAEVKGTGGKLSEKQREFLAAAKRVAIHSGDRFDETEMAGTTATLGVYAWTPDQQDIIEGILRRKVLI